MNQNLHKLQQLTEDQRLDARDRARQMVVKSLGLRPTREQYSHTSISKYPGWVTKLVAGFMLVAFIASAIPSLFRLFNAGRDYYLHSIDVQWQATLVGLSAFLLAEFLIVLSTVTASIFYRGRAKLLWAIPVIMGLLMALVGNYVVAQPSDFWGLLETFIPPLSVIFIAVAGERLILDSIKTRHANERAYQEALTQYNQVVNDPEHHTRWNQFYANALKESLRDAQSGGRGTKERQEIVTTLNSRDWAALVRREMVADRWFESVDTADVIEDNPDPDMPATHDPKNEDNPFGNTRLAADANGNMQMIERVGVPTITASTNGKNHTK